MRLLLTSLLLASQLFAQPRLHLIVGTYTGTGSEGIYVYRFNPRDGSTRLRGTAPASNPSWLCMGTDGKTLYAVNEDADSTGTGGGVSAFQYRPGKGKLRLINRQSSAGNHPCYVQAAPGGRWVVAGNYSTGSIAVFPVEAGGGLGAASQVIRHEGKSLHPSRQQAPHVHQTLFTPDGQLLAPDLGLDKLMVYRFDTATGRLEENRKASLTVSSGSGPRHAALHPSGNWVYLTEELSGTVAAFRRDAAGRLKLLQRISAVPEEYRGSLSGADIHLSPDGRFLYSSNRGELNNIAIFAVDSLLGILKTAGAQPTLGLKPRNFTISPDGRYLLAANQDSDSIVIFERNAETGLLTDTGKRIRVSRPACLIWAE